jgi:glycosyltransferase involved in cell wall biosynthesis
MRIAHFIEHLPCGGVSSVVDLIHRATTAAGHESRVISGGRAADWATWLPSARDWTDDLGFPRDDAIFWRRGPRRRLCEALEARLRDWAPEVVHLHQIPTLIRIAPVLRRLNRPCVFTVHGLLTAYAGPGLRRFFLRHAFRRALLQSRCRCVAVSPSSARYVEQGLGLEPGRFKVQPNPMEVDRFSVQEPAGVPPRTVLMMSRLIWMKRIQDGVRALALLDGEPAFRLRIAGGGPMREKLEALAASVSVAPRVEFLGVRRDIPDLLREAGVVWHLSKSEGGPMVALEAMAAGVPVVATDVPGTADLVKDGVNGLLVPLGDPAAVAAATRRLWADDALRRRLMEGGRATADEHRMERVGAEYVEHYRRAVAEYGGV